MQLSDFGWNGNNGWFTVAIGVAIFWLLMANVPFLTQYTGHVLCVLLMAYVVVMVLIVTHM